MVVSKYGWLLCGIGLVFAGSIGFNFLLFCYENPDTNDSLWGCLSMAGVGAGLLTAAIGALRTAVVQEVVEV